MVIIMLYNNSNYKGNNIDSNNILDNFFNPYEYNIESNLKDRDINSKIRSESHMDRRRKLNTTK